MFSPSFFTESQSNLGLPIFIIDMINVSRTQVCMTTYEQKHVVHWVNGARMMGQNPSKCDQFNFALLVKLLCKKVMLFVPPPQKNWQQTKYIVYRESTLLSLVMMTRVDCTKGRWTPSHIWGRRQKPIHVVQCARKHLKFKRFWTQDVWHARR